MANKESFEYQDRDELDGALRGAIADILDAERQAKTIIEKAETSVKAIQAESLAAERTQKEIGARELAAAREKKLADAKARAEREREQKVADAVKAGEKLLADKRGLIEKTATELYNSLRGQ